MEVIYHPQAKRDVLAILHYYHQFSPRLSAEFQEELKAFIQLAAKNPLRFRPVRSELHRGNLRRFPYHFIYDVQPDVIRVLIVRHNKRHPDFGMDRK